MVVPGARMLALISEQVIVYTWVYAEFRQAIMRGLILADGALARGSQHLGP